MGPGREALLAALAVVAVGLIHLFRDPATYLLPPLLYEDGRDFFAFFYHHRQAGAVLRSYAGYVSVLPNLAGWAALALPVTRAPHALAAFAWAAATLAFTAPQWALRRWIPRPEHRLALCLTLALLPVANRLFLGSVAYSIWNLLLLLVWLSVAPPPSRAGRAALRLGVAVLLIASHPLSLALAPLYALGLAWAVGWPRPVADAAEEAWGTPGDGGRRGVPAVYYGALLAAVVLYQVFGVESGAADPPAVLRGVLLTLAFTLERVVFGALFGDAALHDLRAAGTVWPVYALAVLAVGLAVGLAVRHRRRLGAGSLGLLGALGYLILALTALYVLGRSPGWDILQAGAAFRYTWVQRLLLAGALAILVSGLLDPPRGEGRRSPASAPRHGGDRRWRSVLLWLLFAWLTALNLLNNDSYRSPRRQGHRVAGFVEEVARQEAAGGTVDARMPRRGPWSIELGEAAAESGGDREDGEGPPGDRGGG